MTVINGSQLLAAHPIKNMLTTKERSHGVSHGLAEVGYDIRIKQDVWFAPKDSRFYRPKRTQESNYFEEFSRFNIYEQSVITMEDPDAPIECKPGRFTIASAIEEFDMPDDLVGIVHDKSTWARRGLSVFNTVIEPGWKGFLTLELVYHASEPLHIPAGAGIAQVIFHQTVEAAAYAGKYQNQADRPVAAIHEEA